MSEPCPRAGGCAWCRAALGHPLLSYSLYWPEKFNGHVSVRVDHDKMLRSQLELSKANFIKVESICNELRKGYFELEKKRNALVELNECLYKRVDNLTLMIEICLSVFVVQVVAITTYMLSN